MKISKYVKLGLLMVFSLSVLVWGLSYLKGHDFFKPVNYYFSRYHRVDGLLESSIVTVNGFRVGTVKKIQFANDRSGDLIVTFMIDDNFRIPRKSAAIIVSSDIMGTKNVKLNYSNDASYYSPGDTIPGEIESGLKEQVSLQVLPLKNKAEELLSTIDSAITVLTVLFNEEARRNLSESFYNINQTVMNLEHTSADLQDIMSHEKTDAISLIGNLEAVSGTLKNNSARFNNVIKNLSEFSDTLSALPLTQVVNDVARSAHSIQNILSKMNSDKSTAGLLFNDDELYKNLTGLTSSLERLLSDIRSNPKKYIHFSAINMGKDVYIDVPPASSGTSQNITFKIHLISTANRLQLQSPVFTGLENVEESEKNGIYSYYAGNSASYAQIEKNLTIARRSFPDATIVAYRKGKVIKLEKALRLINGQ